MTDNIINLNLVTTQRVSPDRVLESAAQCGYGLAQVVIIGFKENGDFYFASSEADTGNNLYFLERAKHELMKMEDALYQEGDPRGKPPWGA